MSRIMMNAELVKSAQYKIIIPSVWRDNYLNGLRIASRDHYFRVYCKIMDQMAAYVESIPWFDYGEANLNSEEGLPFFNRVVRELKLSEFAPPAQWGKA